MKPYLGICLILVTLAGICFLAVRSCTSAVDHTIAGVRDAFAQVLRVQPQVTVNERVVLSQTAPIAELAVVTKEEQITLGFNEHLELMTFQIPLTEKKLTAQAIYRLKAGFDLTQPFTVEIDPATQAVHARMPHAKILSVEQVGDLSYHGDDAALNRVTDAERAQIVNNLNSAAHDAAENSGLKEDAEKQVSERLKELLTHNGRTAQLDWDETNPPKVP